MLQASRAHLRAVERRHCARGPQGQALCLPSPRHTPSVPPRPAENEAATRAAPILEPEFVTRGSDGCHCEPGDFVE